MTNTETLDLVLSAIENALYALAQEQNQEENEVFSEWDVIRGAKDVHLYLDDGTVVSIVAQQEKQ